MMFNTGSHIIDTYNRFLLVKTEPQLSDRRFRTILILSSSPTPCNGLSFVLFPTPLPFPFLYLFFYLEV